MENDDDYEKMAELIKNYKEDEEIFFKNWIDINKLLEIIIEKLGECYVKELNWSNFKISYNDNDFFINRKLNPDGSSVYSIKKLIKDN